MDGAHIALALATFLFISLFVGLLIYHIIRTDKLEKKVVSSVCPLAAIIKQEEMIGVSFIPKNKNVDVLMDKVQKLLSLFQSIACGELKKQIDNYRTIIFTEINSNEQYKTITCSKALDTINADLYQAQMQAFQGNETDPRVKHVLAIINELIKYILEITCQGDKIDAAKATQLATDVFDSICHVELKYMH